MNDITIKAKTLKTIISLISVLGVLWTILVYLFAQYRNYVELEFKTNMNTMRIEKLEKNYFEINEKLTKLSEDISYIRGTLEKMNKGR